MHFLNFQNLTNELWKRENAPTFLKSILEFRTGIGPRPHPHASCCVRRSVHSMWMEFLESVPIPEFPEFRPIPEFRDLV
jgi:hypothetical protein